MAPVPARHDGSGAGGAPGPASEAPVWPSGWPELRRLPPAVIDALLLLVSIVVPLTLITVHGDVRDVDRDPSGWAALVALVLAAPLVVLRRRWPLPTLTIGVALSVLMIVITGERTPLLIAVVILLYTVASQTERHTALVAGAATTIVIFVAVATQIDGGAFGADGLATVAWTGLAVAAGDAVRTRREYVVAVEERARRAEETREEEARRRVVEERLRIARELHDVVAHQMAVINVQAAAASHLVRSDPPRAAEAMDHVRSSASTVLQELGGLLHLLRASDDEHAPVEPTPTLKDLDALVGSFRALGLAVTWVEQGRPHAVPESVEVVTYRLVQEALTNAHKHGSGDVTLTVSYEPGAVVVQVDNPLRAGGAPVSAGSGEPLATRTRDAVGPGTGLGIVGMGERAASVGGTVTAAETVDGRFVVTARLPLDPKAAT